MQANLQKAQEELANEIVEGSAGGGMVTAKATGAGRIVEIKIAPEAIDPDDPETLEDLVVAAVNNALDAAQTPRRVADGRDDAGPRRPRPARDRLGPCAEQSSPPGRGRSRRPALRRVSRTSTMQRIAAGRVRLRGARQGLVLIEANTAGSGMFVLEEGRVDVQVRGRGTSSWARARRSASWRC